MNILFITTSFPLHPNATSGVFVKRLVDALRKKANVEVLTPDDNFSTNHQKGVRAFRYAPKKSQILAHVDGGIPASLQKSKKNYLYAASLLAFFLINTATSARRADLIHANWSVPGIVGGLTGLFFNKPSITTLRGEDVTRAKSSHLFKFFLWLCTGMNKFVICVSQEMQQELQYLFPRFRSKILHIPNGIGRSFWVERANSENAKEDQEFIRILSVGSLIPRKNIRCTIDAIKKSKHKDKIKLDIVGDGPERSNLANVTNELGLNENIQFSGKMSPDKIFEAYASADIFVISSFSEGRPNVLLEAMSSGLAIIASKISGIKELIDDGVSGYLFNPNDSQQLATLIDNLIESPETRKLFSSSAQKIIQEKCMDWDSSAAQYLDVYYSLTTNNGAQ